MLTRTLDLPTRIRDTDCIFFDVGDTLRRRVPDAALRTEMLRALADRVAPGQDADALELHLMARYLAYRKWSERTLIEAPEAEFWTRWMLPELPPAQVAVQADELTHFWRMRHGRPVLQPDAEAVLCELARRGYRLGVISNTISSHEVTDTLEEWGLTDYFSAMVLSSRAGRRKPDPEIFWQATRQAGVEPAQSAYVGDMQSLDVIGSRRAGFAVSILMPDPGQEPEDLSGFPAEEQAITPDRVIRQLTELLDLFPPRPGRA